MYMSALISRVSNLYRNKYSRLIVLQRSSQTPPLHSKSEQQSAVILQVWP